ncbi:hypothetical protein HK098_004672 [Nowakowskiella sp. JEL0407]|nr:hypothetical protein HK098_004672 [Nowakowskiella sp. JEL0407]
MSAEKLPEVSASGSKGAQSLQSLFVQSTLPPTNPQVREPLSRTETVVKPKPHVHLFDLQRHPQSSQTYPLHRYHQSNPDLLTNNSNVIDFQRINQSSVRSNSSHRSVLLQVYNDENRRTDISVESYLASKKWEAASNEVNVEDKYLDGKFRSVMETVQSVEQNRPESAGFDSEFIGDTTDGMVSSDNDEDEDGYLSVRSESEFRHRVGFGDVKKGLGDGKDIVGPELKTIKVQRVDKKKNPSGGLGTLAGVYFPCVQNIIGVIVFVRLAWIVGIAGIGHAMLIAFLATSVTFLTTLSVCAIATNGRIPAGGAYYMISRSLGKEFGGSVGILFYLANVVGGVMYVLGVVEILINNVAPQISFGNSATDARVYGSVLVVILASIVTIGMNFINRASMLFLSAVILALLAALSGLFASNRPGMVAGVSGFPGNFQQNFAPAYDKPDINGKIYNDVGFFTLFAVFFPSVTGIMAGASRSGDLKDPQRSIPRGTLAAQLSTTALYFTFIILFGVVISGDLLRTKIPPASTGGLLIASIAWPTPWITLIGCLFASLGAGLQCFVGAPRLLQAVAKDEIIPFLSLFKPLSTSWGILPAGEPRRALLLTILIAEAIVLIGNLDFVANVVTMLYLITYLFVNASTSLLGFLQSPNWRPSWKFYHWTVSAFAAILCLATMFMISWYSSLIALVVLGIAYKYIEYRGARVQWGDGFQALNLQIAQRNLINLQRESGLFDSSIHVKNWRPQIIAIVDIITPKETTSDVVESSGAVNVEADRKIEVKTETQGGKMSFLKKKDRGEKNNVDVVVDGFKLEFPGVLDFLAQLKLGGGLSMLCSVVVGDVLSKGRDGTMETVQKLMDKSIASRRFNAFSETFISTNKNDGLLTAIQTVGVGALRPNTVLLPFPEIKGRTKAEIKEMYVEFVRLIKSVSVLDKALLVVKGLNNFPKRREKLPQNSTIDVYWVMHDGGILALLPHLLRKHPIWSPTKLRIFTVAQFSDNSVQLQNALKSSLAHLRIPATAEILELDDNIPAQADASSIGVITDEIYERTIRFQSRVKVLKDHHGANIENNVLMYPSAKDLFEKDSNESLLNEEKSIAEGRSSNSSNNGGGGFSNWTSSTMTTSNNNSNKKLNLEDIVLDFRPGVQQPRDSEASAEKATSTSVSSDSNSKKALVLSNIFMNSLLKPPYANKHYEILKNAQRLNSKIKQRSQTSTQLILLNLPTPGKIFEEIAEEYLSLNSGRSNEMMVDEVAGIVFMEYLECLINGLNDRIIFVKGTGKEVVTAFF